ncbi:hypothetical protein PAXRUDRAFT_457504 [Paxillus rubicundulus Ve08.2h10]|uniref:Paired domain-containing protein n=1 Tax=Paxillus rubicundulus Ve08.2h10 TaxID=930991 RepID=A0A0D0DWL7_9AGAM|nr:hypothetical protein PAXRUDRAFT_457504 [Paxillus rubicundulus Ve08.2h10]
MPPHLSSDLRHRVVTWRYEGRKSVAEIVELAGCSEHTVFKILRLHCDFRHVNNPFACCRGHPRSLDQHDLTYI